MRGRAAATVPYLLGTDKKQARARAMELLERVGLDPAFARRYPAQLSGGHYADGRVGVPVGDRLPPIPAPALPNARLRERR